MMNNMKKTVSQKAEKNNQLIDSTIKFSIISNSNPITGIIQDFVTIGEYNNSISTGIIQDFVTIGEYNAFSS